MGTEKGKIVDFSRKASILKAICGQKGRVFHADRSGPPCRKRLLMKFRDLRRNIYAVYFLAVFTNIKADMNSNVRKDATPTC
jgi:hypothetical protein